MIYEKKDTTALITINRPKALNAFNSQMLDELTEALEMAEQGSGHLRQAEISRRKFS